MDAVYDVFVSRHMNRKLSDPVAWMRTRTRMTPNQATCGATGTAIFSLVILVMGQNVLGVILAQLSSVADAIDGNLARLKGMTSVFGGFLDSVLDRYANTLIVLGMILWSRSNETCSGIWLVGFLAMVGTFHFTHYITGELRHDFCY